MKRILRSDWDVMVLDSSVLTANWAGQKLRKSVFQVCEAVQMQEAPNGPLHRRKPPIESRVGVHDF